MLCSGAGWCVLGGHECCCCTVINGDGALKSFRWKYYCRTKHWLRGIKKNTSAGRPHIDRHWKHKMMLPILWHPFASFPGLHKFVWRPVCLLIQFFSLKKFFRAGTGGMSRRTRGCTFVPWAASLSILFTCSISLDSSSNSSSETKIRPMRSSNNNSSRLPPVVAKAMQAMTPKIRRRLRREKDSNAVRPSIPRQAFSEAYLLAEREFPLWRKMLSIRRWFMSQSDCQSRLYRDGKFLTCKRRSFVTPLSVLQVYRNYYQYYYMCSCLMCHSVCYFTNLLVLEAEVNERIGMWLEPSCSASRRNEPCIIIIIHTTTMHQLMNITTKYEDLTSEPSTTVHDE